MTTITEIDREKEDYRPGFMEFLTPTSLRNQSKRRALKTGIVVTPKFTLLALASFVDAIRLASDIGDRSRQYYCEWNLMSVDGGSVRSSCGIEVTPWSRLQDAAPYDYLVVIGGLVDAKTEYDEILLTYIRRVHDSGIPVIGICTGSFILAATGLLDGRKCCVHGYHLEEFNSRFPKIQANTNQIFIDEDDLITCAGGIASLDLAAHLVQRHCGRERALKIQHHAVVDRFRAETHDQLPLADPYFDMSDKYVRNSLFIMEQHIDRSITIAAIAKMVGCTRRHLNRSFHKALGVSPSGYFSELRLNHALWLLGNSNHSITVIATECGFSDGSHLARRFKSRYGGLPSQARNRYNT